MLTCSMGNNSTRESRGSEAPSAFRSADSPASSSQQTSPTVRNHTQIYASRSGRGSRPDLSFLGMSSGSTCEVPERRETKQEREARKLEKERQARIKERQRSIKEEHVDGGYLVTMGVYTGPEDFNKPIVRQLMVERRIAPFWRGLNEFSESWTEHQLIAAGRGLPIPAADEIPAEEFSKINTQSSPSSSNPNLHGLTVPISSRTHSADSDPSATLSPSHPAFFNGNPTSPISLSSTAPPSSPFRPRSKTLASLTNTSKNPSSSEIIPSEIRLPLDAYVNGQAIEVYLYKDAIECPICFLSYPPFLNKTRCCDQPICSECFVQIKRPDPHPPEHHDPSNQVPQDPASEAESLVSEPACCPYCQQSEFGVIYEPPPFRRGLSHANALNSLAKFPSAMSSSSSLNSGTVYTSSLSPTFQKRRTTSISANASMVITTDRVRPDWATKLANARSHLARRSAAATALHTAAYLMGNSNTDSRGFVFRPGRLSRNRGGDNPSVSGPGRPIHYAHDSSGRLTSDHVSTGHRDGLSAGESRRSRMEDIEELMMMEAIRLSLAAEDERKKKAEKEAAKEATKEARRKAKEDKKREKREKKVVYGSGGSSASASTPSLHLPGLGRRRGDSGGGTLQRELTSDEVEQPNLKGKGISRRPVTSSGGSIPIDFSRSGTNMPTRHSDSGALNAVNENHGSSNSAAAPEHPSHLRQSSNASSPVSSFVESIPGSLRNNYHAHGSSSSLDSPNTSGTNIAAHSGAIPDVSDSNDKVGSESLFNFQSLAAMISDEEDTKNEKSTLNLCHIEDIHFSGESSRRTDLKDDCNSQEVSSHTENKQPRHGST